MFRARCCKDVFGYCSDPPEGAAQHVYSATGDNEWDNMGKCLNDWQNCPKYIYHSVITLTPLASAKKKRTLIKI